MRALIVLVAAFVLSLTILGAQSASAASGVPSCAIDDNGNCVVNDEYGDQDASSYFYYTDSVNNCKAVWVRRNWKSIWGFTFWRYYEQVNWCYRYGQITALTRYRWPSDTGYGWSFDGNIASNCSSEQCSEMAGSTWATVYTQGSFHACYTWFCNYKYPQVWITVNGYGGWGYQTND